VPGRLGEAVTRRILRVAGKMGSRDATQARNGRVWQPRQRGTSEARRVLISEVLCVYKNIYSGFSVNPKTTVYCWGIWSGCRDLNPGPLAPQASALARLRHSPNHSLYSF
jgi:hypothetical protein